MKKSVLILGGGGREHALTEIAAANRDVRQVFWHPGNGGIVGADSKIKLSGLPPDASMADIIKFAKGNDVGLTIPGGEDWLARGTIRQFEDAGLAAFGPFLGPFHATEGSKAEAKRRMMKYGVTTPIARTFTRGERDLALDYLSTCRFPIMIKASGLCAGKGAIECKCYDAGATAIYAFCNGELGAASETFLVEEYVIGREFSVFAFVDNGGNIKVMPAVVDHKDLSRNDPTKTGGLGAYTRPSFVTDEIIEYVTEYVFRLYIDGLASEGISFHGLLYAGLMLAGDGTVYLLEWNARFGDPELQALARIHEGGMIEMMLAIAHGESIEKMELTWSKRASLALVVYRAGYPRKPGEPVLIPKHLLTPKDSRVKVFHAGSKRAGEAIVSSGGRVLTVTATSDTLPEARRLVHSHIGSLAELNDSGLRVRSDIGA